MPIEKQVMMVTICFWLSFFIPMLWLRLLFFIILVWLYRDRFNKWLFVLLLLAMLLSWISLLPKSNAIEDQRFCGFISRIGDGWINIQTSDGLYSVFSEKAFIIDQLICVIVEVKPIKFRSNFEQDPLMIWSNRVNYQGTITIKQIESIQTVNTLRSRVYTDLKANNHHLLLTIFFQQPTTIAPIISTFLVAYGMIYSTMITLLKKGLRLLFYERTTNIILLSLWLLAWLWGDGSFVWWRILLTMLLPSFFKSKKFVTFIGFNVLLLLYPTMFNQIGFVFPVVFRLLSYIKENTWIKRTLLLLLFQHTFFYSSNLLWTLAYPIIRIVIGLMMMHAILCIPLPFLRESFESFWFFLSELEPSWMLPYFIYRGKFSGWLLALVIMLLIGEHHVLKHKSKILALFLVATISVTRVNPFTRTIFFNVGQADAAAVFLPFNQGNIMIDVGRASNYPMLKRSLFAIGVKRIDAIIISHMDDDHAGGLSKFSQDFLVKQVIVDKVDVFIDDWTVFALLNDYQGTSVNDNSVISYYDQQGLRFLFLGDLYQAGERALIRHYPTLPVDILKVAHHGSMTSSEPLLFAHYQPVLAIISSDPSVYNHPADVTLKTLAAYRINTLATYIHGDISISSFKDFHLVATSNHLFGIIKPVRP